jgi:3D (Asp-Asp-Asp) domain-containing protein
MRACAVALTATVLAITGASTAMATARQTIACDTPVFNDTVKHGKFDVDTAFLEREIAMFEAFAPAGTVYAHAYERIPGGSLDAFMEMAREQCPNWGTNTVAVVYGRDIDDIGIFKSYGFLPIEPYEERIMKGVKVGLGPETTQVSSDAVTSVLVDALIGARYYLELSAFYDEETGIYTAPVRPAPYTADEEIPMPLMVLYVLAGFAAFGLVAHLVGKRIRR